MAQPQIDLLTIFFIFRPLPLLLVYDFDKVEATTSNN